MTIFDIIVFVVFVILCVYIALTISNIINQKLDDKYKNDDDEE